MKFVIIGTGEWQKSLYSLLESNHGAKYIWGVGPSKPKWFNYKFFKTDIRNHQAIRDHFNSIDDNFIFISSQTDVAVKTVAYLNQFFNIEYTTPDVAEIYTNKFKMREHSKLSGFKELFYKEILTRELDSHLSKASKKFVTKPINLQSSIGVKLWDAPNELNELLEYKKSMIEKNIDHLIIEDYIDGEEFTVEGYKFRNGEHKILGISKKSKNCGFGVANDLVYSSEHLEGNNYKNIEKILNRYFIKYLYGPTHTEIIIDNNDNIYLVEAAIRGGGSNIPSIIIPSLCKFHPEKQLIADILNKGTLQKIDYMNTNISLSFFRVKTNNYEKYNFKHPNIISSWLADDYGMPVKPVTDDRSRHGYVVFSFKNPDDLQDLKSQIISLNSNKISFYE